MQAVTSSWFSLVKTIFKLEKETTRHEWPLVTFKIRRVLCPRNDKNSAVEEGDRKQKSLLTGRRAKTEQDFVQ